VDDVLTTGSTLAAAAERLRSGGLPVRGAVVIAATRKIRVEIDTQGGKVDTS
jgi:orotate phosphoribosyltransferase